MHHDPRLTAARPDLAAAHLKGELEAESFETGLDYQVIESATAVRKDAHPDAQQLTQALFGEVLTVYEEREGWVWGQLREDGYVGYLSQNALSRKVVESTHRVSVLRTYVYPQASIKSAPIHLLSLNSSFSASGEREKFIQLESGSFVYEDHVILNGEYKNDFVAIAEKFIGTPYFWGGKTSLGLDCSALVQMSLAACGRSTLRDSDMLQDQLGEEIPISADLSGLRRGDLVFWQGHVGVMCDDTRMLHCNGYHMATVIEPLKITRERISRMYGEIIMIKRMNDYFA